MTNYVSDEMVLQIIEKGISSLGENPEQATWLCLEKDFNLNRQKVPENLGEFQQALQKLFGQGSNLLDALFRDSLGEATGEDVSNYSSFTECVAVLRKKQRAGSTATHLANDSVVTISKTDSMRLTGQNEERSSPKRTF
jgi:hypothetical protein